MKRYTTLAVALATVCAVSTDVSADIYTEALASIERNNLQLQSLGAQRDAETEATRVGQTLANPELELGYLWGADGGPDRKDLGLSQEFDLTQLSGAKGKVASAQRRGADAAYAESRRQVMLDAKMALIDLIAAKATEKICRDRDRQVKAMSGAALRLMESGQMSRIDYNKARLAEAESQHALTMASIELDKAVRKVAQLNGGQPLQFGYDAYPEEEVPADFQTWVAEAVSTDPAMLALRSEIEVSDKEIGLAKAGNLPSFTLGYAGEFIEGGTLNGVSLGISLPLWGNSGAVKAAKAQRRALEFRQEESARSLRSDLETTYQEALALSKLERAYASATSDADIEPMLAKAFEKGEISVTDYLDETSYKTDVEQRRLEIQRQLHSAIARLNSYRL